MRISDWSSDVCSSDLPGRRSRTILEENVADAVAEQDIGHERLERERSAHHHVAHFAQLAPAAIELVGLGHIEAGPCADLPAVVVEQRGVRKGCRDMLPCLVAADRKSVVKVTSVSVRVTLGGDSNSKKK